MKFMEFLKPERAHHAAWLSAFCALCAVLIGVPSCFVALHQATELNASAASSAESLKQAKAAVEEAHRFAVAAELSAKEADRIADSTRDQARATSRLADEADHQAREATLARIAAEKQADLMARNAADAQERNRALQTPELMIKAVNIDPIVEGRHLEWRAILENSHPINPDFVQITTRWDMIPRNESRPPTWDVPCNSSEPKVPYGVGSFEATSSVMTKDNIDSLNSGRLTLYVRGRICYPDEKGKLKRVDYCDEVQLNGHVYACVR